MRSASRLRPPQSEPASDWPRWDRGCSGWCSDRSCTLRRRARPAGEPGATVLWSVSWSEPQVDREEEAAVRRERCHVDVPHDRLVAEVADFRIEPAIGGDTEQIATAQTEPRLACARTEQAPGERLREVIRERHLAELEVRRI